MKPFSLEYTSKNGLYFHHTLTNHPTSVNGTPFESHSMCELFLLLSGSVNYSIEGKLYKVSPYDLLIIAPHELHSVKASPEESYDRMVLQFSLNLLPVFQDFDITSVFAQPTSIAHIIPAEFIIGSNIVSLMKDCENCCKENNQYVDLRLMQIILRITEEIDKIIAKIKASDRKDLRQPIHVNTISHKCINYVNSNINNSFSIQDIADSLHISASHLKHSFKNEIGITLHKYIANQKMQLAKSLLAKGESPQSVSKALGYEYYYTFYQNYTKRFGCSPSSYNALSYNTLKDTSYSPPKLTITDSNEED